MNPQTDLVHAGAPSCAMLLPNPKRRDGAPCSVPTQKGILSAGRLLQKGCGPQVTSKTTLTAWEDVWLGTFFFFLFLGYPVRAKCRTFFKQPATNIILTRSPWDEKQKLFVLQQSTLTF